MPLIDTDKPENSLANVNAYVESFIGTGKTDLDIPSLIDTVVKRIHRRWHPRWTHKYVDATIPITTGTYLMPSDFNKMSRITNQSNEPTTFYEPSVDYDLQGYNTSTTDPRRQLQWITVPTTALSVRVWYWRQPTRAVDMDDLVDIPEDSVDLILYGIQMILAAKDVSLDAYDRWRMMFEEEMQRWIDDDYDLDAAGKSIPMQSDGSIVQFDSGELI